MPPANPLAIAAAQDSAQLEEQRVAAVRVVSESGEVLAENPADLAQQAGQSYRSDAVRESLRQLYRSGRYADVRAEASTAENGVRLDFIVLPGAYINSVHVTGLKEPPAEGQALAALQLGLGEIYRERALRDALERLQQTLRDEGFYQAAVDVARKEIPATHQLDIVLQVTPGPRARIGEVTQQGEPSFAASNELLRRARLKPGKEVTSVGLDRAAERVRKYLTKRGHLSARVGVRRGEFDAKSNTVPLALEVFTGLQIRVELNGAKISNRRLHQLLPIYQEGAVDEDLLQEGRRNIRDYLESQGYFDSQVRYDTSEDTKTGFRVITYAVERGEQRRLAGIEFTGNRYFSTSLLRERLVLLPASFSSHGRFSQRLLESDADSIQQMYVANGFRDAKADWEKLEDYQGKKGDLYVRFRITEGPQTLVSSLKLEGNNTLDNDFLLSVVGSSQGQPYSEFNMSGDRDNILALYYNEGFPEARFEPVAVEDGAPNRMKLTYRIVEGPQFKVKKVLLGGYQFTRENTIAREVKLALGEPLRQGDLVETQRRLYNLGIFNRVQIAPQNPSGTDTDKTLLVLVEEAKRYTIAYGGGVEVQRLGSASDPVGGEIKASPRGIFEISKANVLGRAHTLGFKVRASTLQGRALLSYFAPIFLGRPSLSFQLTGFADKTRDVRTFTSTRYEGTLQVAQQVSNITSLQYRFGYRRVQVDAKSLKVAFSQIPLFSQPTLVALLGVSWVREKRNNPADATRGNFTTADFSVASRALGSSASFLRVFVQNSSFHPLPRRLSFARSMRIGIQRALGSTTPDEIPLPERFFAGGGNSLRGFALNQAGPRDPVTGFPIGGQALLLFNQELRFPMRLPFVKEPVGGAIFYDVGNVFSRASRISLRASPSAADVTSGELKYMAHAIGVGFRYATPIGPVRLDLGYLLNPAIIEFCSASGTPAPPGRCPAPAPPNLERSRLPRFHFYFSIGSLF